jgi:hypothetical protein
MNVTTGFRDGLGRVRRAPALVAGVWLSTLLLALGPAVVVHSQIEAHLGASLMADTATSGVNFDWWNEFLAQASGVGQTFVPAVLGFAAVLDNLDRLADQRALPPVLAGLVAAQLLLSLFLAGGLLDRLARDRAVGAAAFFSACGVWTGRFMRMALLVGPVYVWLFLHVHHWLLGDAWERFTHDVTVERQAFALRLALYAVFTAMVCAVNVVVDYAKVRAVVEDRRSMIGALVAGWRFVVRHPAKTLGLYLLNLGLAALVAAVYFLLAPGASAPLLAFAIGQMYIVLRVIVRLQFMASQTALFQGALAHAGYVARPVPRWPDSPTAEAILRS